MNVVSPIPSPMGGFGTLNPLVSGMAAPGTTQELEDYFSRYSPQMAWSITPRSIAAHNRYEKLINYAKTLTGPQYVKLRQNPVVVLNNQTDEKKMPTWLVVVIVAGIGLAGLMGYNWWKKRQAGGGAPKQPISPITLSGGG